MLTRGFVELQGAQWSITGHAFGGMVAQVAALGESWQKSSALPLGADVDPKSTLPTRLDFSHSPSPYFSTSPPLHHPHHPLLPHFRPTLTFRLTPPDLGWRGLCHWSHSHGAPRVFNPASANLYNSLFGGEAGQRTVANEDSVPTIIPESDDYTFTLEGFHIYGTNSTYGMSVSLGQMRALEG